MTTDYRAYQHDAVRAVFASFDAGHRAALCVMPTGTGKTNVAGIICQEASETRNWRTLFIAHRGFLVNQAAERLVGEFSLDVMTEMGSQNARRDGERYGGHSEVVVGTVQSLQGDRLAAWPEDHFGLIIVDECHRAGSNQHRSTLARFPSAKILGITATPEGGKVAQVFEHKAFEYTFRQATLDGYIVPIRRRVCPVPIDLRSISTLRGEFNKGDLAERIGPNLERIARAIVHEIDDRPTVVFVPGVGCSLALADILTRLGVPAVHVAGLGRKFGMPAKERKERLQAFEAGIYQVVICSDLLIEGWDCPKIRAVVIARPTCKLYRFRQMVGRGTRPCDSIRKTDLLVVDFDWQVDPSVRDLCSEFDLIAEEVEPLVATLARERLKADATLDIIAAIERAEETVSLCRQLSIPLTGATVEYTSYECDPVGVAHLIDCTWKKKTDMYNEFSPKCQPASEGQIRFLHGLGVRSTEGISSWGASKLIEKLKRRRDRNLARPDQIKELIDYRVPPTFARNMSEANATEAIQSLLRLGPLSHP